MIPDKETLKRHLIDNGGIVLVTTYQSPQMTGYQLAAQRGFRQNSSLDPYIHSTHGCRDKNLFTCASDLDESVTVKHISIRRKVGERPMTVGYQRDWLFRKRPIVKNLDLFRDCYLPSNAIVEKGSDAPAANLGYGVKRKEADPFGRPHAELLFGLVSEVAAIGDALHIIEKDPNFAWELFGDVFPNWCSRPDSRYRPNRNGVMHISTRHQPISADLGKNGRVEKVYSHEIVRYVPAEGVAVVAR